MSTRRPNKLLQRAGKSSNIAECQHGICFMFGHVDENQPFHSIRDYAVFNSLLFK